MLNKGIDKRNSSSLGVWILELRIKKLHLNRGMDFRVEDKETPVE